MGKVRHLGAGGLGRFQSSTCQLVSDSHGYQWDETQKICVKDLVFLSTFICLADLQDWG